MKSLVKIPKFERYSVNRFGKVYDNEKNRFLKINKKIGYQSVSLVNNLGARSCFYVHRLVAQCFIPNQKSKPQVNHINGIRNDNRVENLEWCTGKENSNHAWENGMCTKHNGRPKKKCIINGVKYNSVSEAAKSVGYTQSHISHCLIKGISTKKLIVEYA